MMSEIVGLFLGAILTIFILSYLVGDNPLYRLSLHLFIGTLVGYSFGTVFRQVLLGMALPMLLSNPAVVVAPLVLGILLLFKGFPRQAYIGNFPIAYLVGVGTGVALGGALLGTLVPQIGATGRALGAASVRFFRFGLLDGLMVVVGTICTLLAFTFTRPPQQRIGAVWGSVLSGAAWIGRVFLIVAFGLAFAGALTASLSIFIGRVQSYIDLAFQVLGP
jgi:hypothetical protein